MKEIVLVLATRNKGKMREFEQLFNDLPVEIKGVSEFRSFTEFEEEGSTFEEIAINKAKCVSKALDLPAIADDSGLAVEALHGAPGIFSARYAGKSATNGQNNRKLLEKMEGKKNRDAIFVCSIAISKPNGQVLTYTGECSGIILHEPVGTNGFGYDPFFYYPPLKKTFAQLSVEEKSGVSHRGQAIGKVKNDFKKIMIWLKEK
jgi:XTP/dITP diphosphohydrolase